MTDPVDRLRIRDVRGKADRGSPHATELVVEAGEDGTFPERSFTRHLVGVGR